MTTAPPTLPVPIETEPADQAPAHRRRLLPLSPAHRRISEGVLAALVFLWGAYLSLWNLGAANENVDERAYIDAGWAYLHGDMTLNLEHPPTAKYLYGIAQLIGGQGLLSGRVLAGLCVLGTGIILWAWLRRELGGTLALIPTLLWFGLPRGNDDTIVRLDRFALLEPVMVLFLVAAAAAAWQWYRHDRWWWIALSGVLMGAAVTSKVSAAIFLVAFLVLAFVRRPVWRILRDVAIFVAALGGTFVALYSPVDMVAAITYMLEMQSEHNTVGHMVAVAGEVTASPPWWSNLWYMLVGMGAPALVLVGVGSVAALVVGRPSRLVLFLGTGLAGLLAFHLVGSNVALSHYYTAWFWLMCALAGIGVAALLAPGNRDRVTGVGRGVGVVALVLALGVSAGMTAYVANDRPRGAALVQEALALDPAIDGSILVAAMPGHQYGPYWADLAVTSLDELAVRDVRAIVIGDDARFQPDERITEFVDAHRAEIRIVQLDDAELIILDAPLRLTDGGETLAY
ncbi:glycosyltransferase family 39 protein [Pseudoclavibacter sp. RFBA6]|uniref:ArnT family glycosyltransferase n=1 Tax=Pseudoclavibacter sp. RFBA6 TaxID=2080573 RepID=UPI0015E1C1D0|nr:glycosyltransferase family 39 protein [Pseudoclavibacter sp. RFBA6]